MIACLALGLTLSACRTEHGASADSFASVTILNRTPEEIQARTALVFRDAGYREGAAAGNNMVFEKGASALTTVGRDGVVAASGGARSLERVKVEVVYNDPRSYRLRCHAYMVSGAGDSFFEEEVEMLPLRSGPYRSLLNQVATQLK